MQARGARSRGVSGEIKPLNVEGVVIRVKDSHPQSWITLGFTSIGSFALGSFALGSFSWFSSFTTSGVSFQYFSGSTQGLEEDPRQGLISNRELTPLTLLNVPELY